MTVNSKSIEYWITHRCFRCGRRAINPKVAKHELKLIELGNSYICEKCYNYLYSKGESK